MDKISVIVPCKNEELSLPYFIEEINKVRKELSEVAFELIFIDDGSVDKTLEVIKEMRQKDKDIRYISFSRNFKKEAANYAGLSNATGDYAVIIDADLQHPPRFLIEMYQTLKEGEYDCVAGRRTSRKGEGLFKRIGATIFYPLMNSISKATFVSGATDFCMMNKKMYQAIAQMPEYNRFTKGMNGWIGFKTKWIAFPTVERVAGTSKFHLKYCFTTAIDSIVSFSNFPLLIAYGVGIAFGIAFLVLLIILIVKAIVGSAIGTLLVISTLLTLIAALQFIFMGIIGTYLYRTYEETKHRPIYIAKETEKDEK